jgi:hypothetical protein
MPTESNQSTPMLSLFHYCQRKIAQDSQTKEDFIQGYYVRGEKMTSNCCEINGKRDFYL